MIVQTVTTYIENIFQ